MPAIIGLRPTVSNSRPSSSGPEEVADRERDDVAAARCRRVDVVERRQHQRVGEEDGVVEERLADEQREADDGAAAGSAPNIVLAISMKPRSSRSRDLDRLAFGAAGSSRRRSTPRPAPRCRATSSSASSSRPWMISQRGLSGTVRRTSRIDRGRAPRRGRTRAASRRRRRTGRSSSSDDRERGAERRRRARRSR